MISEKFVILAAVISFSGGMSYLKDVIKGKVKPNRVSWFLWALAPLIAFSAEIRHGVGLPALMTFMVGFNPLIIVIASFLNKKSVWKLSKLDIACGALSVLGLILWLVTGVGNVAILFSILSDGFAAVPTVVKSWIEPESENYIAFLASAISAGITLLAIKTWDFAHVGFPIYILSICILLFVLIKFKIGTKKITAEPHI